MMFALSSMGYPLPLSQSVLWVCEGDRGQAGINMLGQEDDLWCLHG